MDATVQKEAASFDCWIIFIFFYWMLEECVKKKSFSAHSIKEYYDSPLIWCFMFEMRVDQGNTTSFFFLHQKRKKIMGCVPFEIKERWVGVRGRSREERGFFFFFLIWNFSHRFNRRRGRDELIIQNLTNNNPLLFWVRQNEKTKDKISGFKNLFHCSQERT